MKLLSESYADFLEEITGEDYFIASEDKLDPQKILGFAEKEMRIISDPVAKEVQKKHIDTIILNLQDIADKLCGEAFAAKFSKLVDKYKGDLHSGNKGRVQAALAALEKALRVLIKKYDYYEAMSDNRAISATEREMEWNFFTLAMLFLCYKFTRENSRKNVFDYSDYENDEVSKEVEKMGRKRKLNK